MKNIKCLAAAALALLAINIQAHAGTLSGAVTTLNGVSTTTSPPKITSAGQIVQVKHYFGVLYYGPDKNASFTCWAKLEYSDGMAPEMVPVKYPADGVARMHQYTKPGKYTVSLTGTPHNGQVGCLGSATTVMTIADGMPAPAPVATPAPAPVGKASAGGAAAMVSPAGQLAAAQAMTPINVKTRVTLLKLVHGDSFPPGDVLLYSKWAIDKADSNCLLEFSVAALGDGGHVSGPNLLQLNVGGVLPAAGEFNPGSLHFAAQGKFRATMKARTDVENHCSGSAHDDFEIKRKAIGL
ncbi:MAG: hypothetical protein JWQ72_3011 [Polaromonas sp.]|nr:hypothetical protein [Polaromonas sp.]